MYMIFLLIIYCFSEGNMLNRKVLASVAIVGVLTLGLGAPAQAAVGQTTGPANCGNKEVVTASQTTGSTTHANSNGRQWDKGVKKNSGATTYNGVKNLKSVFVVADKIASSGFRCA